MIRRTFLRRMMGAALASGLLGSELLARRGDGWPAHTTVGPTYVFTFDGREIGGVDSERTTWAEGIRGTPRLERVLGLLDRLDRVGRLPT